MSGSQLGCKDSLCKLQRTAAQVLGCCAHQMVQLADTEVPGSTALTLAWNRCKRSR